MQFLFISIYREMIFLNSETIGNDHVLSRQIAFAALSIAQYRVGDNFKLRRIKLYVCMYIYMNNSETNVSFDRVRDSIIVDIEILTLFQNSIPLLGYANNFLVYVNHCS